MLSSNVLCMKKKKKRSYCVSNVSDYGGKYRHKRGTCLTMMHITEDTPPDMLAGAMDLTIHLPDSRSVKMSVERSTPMMDVLIQITNAHHLQISGFMLQALGMEPTLGQGDKILHYMPNTPIGTLETQHIRVIPKSRGINSHRNLQSGQKPFESTFRLKVHLPRNQLYVSRVSMNIRLIDVMKKVCDEKNLDSSKYEFRHPLNLDEVLDPKLSLNDYQITEVYLLSKNALGLSQTFSSSDIMAYRKEDERKQKSSGGLFNFLKRGKSGNGTGSLSSDRSISPTQSDESRSVTPPAIKQQISAPEKPKPPVRKRRPAPKPPQAKEEILKIEKQNETSTKSNENVLTICHSRNSSDSSGYHEASILSDNANTSLPRRPQTMLLGTLPKTSKLSGEYSKSMSNLSSMSSQSKSTSSLAVTGRKKKAPPPPPILKSVSSIDSLEKASPVVASPVEKQETASIINTSHTNTTTTASTNKTNLQQNNLQLEFDEINCMRNKSEFENIVETNNANFNNFIPLVINFEIASDNKPNIIGAIPKQYSTKRPKSNHTSFIYDKNIKLQRYNSLNTQFQDISSTDFIVMDEVLRGFQNKNTVVNSIPSQETQNLKIPPRNSRNSVTWDLITESVHIHKNATPYTTNSPPESIASSLATTLSSNIETDINLSKENLEIIENDSLKKIEETSVEPVSQDNTKNEHNIKKFNEETSNVYSDVETDWEYQLPSPPTAFRDSSPILDSLTNYDSADINKTDSVVTSPELFEKLTIVKKSQSDATTSEVSEEEKSIYNKLSLENLEKRKSLVYNRELATSLKYEDNQSQSTDSISSKRSSIISELEEVLTNAKTSTLSRINPKSENFIRAATDSSLPNFKITTYDQLKQKINIFEDDSIRSNVAECIKNDNTLTKQYSGEIEVHKEETFFKKPQDFNKYRRQFYKDYNVVARSESVKNNAWVPVNPIKRSKSQIAINQYNSNHISGEISNLAKSKSTIDLQSVVVMRAIQTKLTTFTDNNKQAETKSVETVQQYKYNGPPSINLGTWSDRPKTVEENALNKYSINQNVSNNVSIKINGSEPISSPNSGNVVIKIEAKQEDFSKRFITHTTAAAYRKPLGNINKVERKVEENGPHSIAIETDISRVPIVRSVELKKPFKDFQKNKSITQICPDDTKSKETKSLNYITNKTNSQIFINSDSSHKSKTRINSFSANTKDFISDKQMNSWNSYRTLPIKPKTQDNLTINQNVPFSQCNLRRTESNKLINHHSSNNNMENVLLRNSVNFNNNRYSIGNEQCPPPPPSMPKANKTSTKFESIKDPRDELLSAIRNFGGKKGLKAVKD